MTPEESATVKGWYVKALGGWQLTRAAREVVLPPRDQRLVSLLLIEGRRPRGYLAGCLWPDAPETKSSANLRSTTLDLRRRAPGLISGDNGTLGLAPSVGSDVTYLRTMLRGSSASLVPVDEARYLLGIEELLPGWYDEWVLAERDRLVEGRVARIGLVLEALLDQDELEHALPLARLAVHLEPMRESAHRALVRVHLASGDRVAAWQAYAEFRRRSILEFGVSPSQQFESLVAPLHAERRARKATGLGERRSQRSAVGRRPRGHR